MINLQDLAEPAILSSFAFLIFVLLLVYFASRKVLKENWLKFFLIILFVLLAWFFTVAFFGKTGFISKSYYWLFIPNLAIAFLILFHFLRKAYYSEKIRKIADAIPQHWIIGIQFYRVVGVGFIILYFQGSLPALFAFSAGIGDIIVGITAPFVALACYLKKSYSKNLAVAWNILGILDLVIAISVGILGFPRPVQFLPLYPSTEPISLFPLVMVPLFAVPIAIILHLFSLRGLRKGNV